MWPPPLKWTQATWVRQRTANANALGVARPQSLRARNSSQPLRWFKDVCCTPRCAIFAVSLSWVNFRQNFRQIYQLWAYPTGNGQNGLFPTTRTGAVFSAIKSNFFPEVAENTWPFCCVVKHIRWSELSNSHCCAIMATQWFSLGTSLDNDDVTSLPGMGGVFCVWNFFVDLVCTLKPIRFQGDNLFWISSLWIGEEVVSFVQWAACLVPTPPKNRKNTEPFVWKIYFLKSSMEIIWSCSSSIF